MKLATIYHLPAILLLATFACRNPPAEPVIDEDLLGVVWKLDSLQAPNGDIVTNLDSPIFTFHSNDTAYTLSIKKQGWKETFITIRFTRDLEIFLDVCNSGYGNYNISQIGAWATDGIGWTEVACPSWHAIEVFLTVTLKNVTAYRRIESRLTLYDKDYLHVVYLSIE